MRAEVVGLELRPDIMGSDDGLALSSYVENMTDSGRLYLKRIVVTQRQEAFKASGRVPDLGESYPDSVGVGSYPIDLHPQQGETTTSILKHCPLNSTRGHDSRADAKFDTCL